MFTAFGLLIEKAYEDDIEALHQLRTEDAAAFHQMRVISLFDQAVWFAELPSTELVLSIRPQIGEIIDSAGFAHLTLDWPNRAALFSYGVVKEQRRKGYGTRIIKAVTVFAFEYLHLVRLNAEVLADNLGSITCFERAALTCPYKWAREGVRKSAVQRTGRRVDSIVWGCVCGED